MTAKGAWGANVWGLETAATARELKEGESACCICFNAPEEIRFTPCKHAVCQPCLDRLRKTNIFKVTMRGTDIFESENRVRAENLLSSLSHHSIAACSQMRGSSAPSAGSSSRSTPRSAGGEFPFYPTYTHQHWRRSSGLSINHDCTLSH